jgi:proline iminopeptidase
LEWLNKDASAWERGTLLNSDGEIAYWSRGQGPLLLFLHGGPGDDHQSLKSLAEKFVQNHRCVLFDQRGSGESLLDEPLSTENVSLEKCLEDISDLRKLFQQDEFKIIGHSWGALLALMYTLQNPETVAKVALISMGPLSQKAEEEASEKWNRKLSTADLEEQTKWKVNRRQALHDKDQKLARKAELELLRISAKVWFRKSASAEQFLAEYAENGRHNRQIAQILWSEYQSFYFANDLSLWKTKALCLYGDDDFEPIDQARELSRKNLNCRAIYIEDAGHFPWMEQPEKTLKALQDFLLGP